MLALLEPGIVQSLSATMKYAHADPYALQLGHDGNPDDIEELISALPI